jgi:hypothetical protein
MGGRQDSCSLCKRRKYYGAMSAPFTPGVATRNGDIMLIDNSSVVFSEGIYRPAFFTHFRLTAD